MLGIIYPHYSIVQNSFIALKIPCASFHPSSPEPLAVTDHFTVSIVLAFPEGHMCS